MLIKGENNVYKNNSSHLFINRFMNEVEDYKVKVG